MEERLNELEIKMAYQDQMIEDLNNIVIELRKEVETLEKKCKHLGEIIDNDDLKDSSLEVPPPHY